MRNRFGCAQAPMPKRGQTIGLGGEVVCLLLAVALQEKWPPGDLDLEALVDAAAADRLCGRDPALLSKQPVQTNRPSSGRTARLSGNTCDSSAASSSPSWAASAALKSERRSSVGRRSRPSWSALA